MSYSDSETVVGAHSFYTVMVQEEQGWRQLVMPALKPEDACQALADLIRTRSHWIGNRMRMTSTSSKPYAWWTRMATRRSLESAAIAW